MIESKLLICEVCNKNEAIGVACVPGVPISSAYCNECLKANAHPINILIINTAMIGGLDLSIDEWREMVFDTLKYMGKSLEWFNQEVDKTKSEI